MVVYSSRRRKERNVYWLAKMFLIICLRLGLVVLLERMLLFMKIIRQLFLFSQQISWGTF